MSLLALPSVLVQSCMHFLLATEILALARCSHSLMGLADSGLAWRECPPISVTIPDPLVPPSSRLLHWIPTALTWKRRDVTADDVALEQLLSWSSATRAAELCIYVIPPNAQPTTVLPQLLTHESMQRLRVLVVPSHAETISLASRLPHLHTMQCSRSASPSIYAPLITAPALTALTMFDVRGDSCLPVLSQIPRLRSLTLVTAAFHPIGVLPQFCSAPTISAGLRRLSIGYWERDGMSDETLCAELSASFRHLRALTHFHWRTSGNLDPIVLSLHHAETIQHFAFSPLAVFTDAAMVSLLTARPRLNCSIEAGSPLGPGVPAAMRVRVAALQAQFPSRLSVLHG